MQELYFLNACREFTNIIPCSYVSLVDYEDGIYFKFITFVQSLIDEGLS